MIASLGIGMHALSRTISTNTAASPAEPMKSVAALTMGARTSAVGIIGKREGEGARRAAPNVRDDTLAGRGVTVNSLPMSRLRDPVYAWRALRFGCDALLAAAAFGLAFRLRFLDTAGGIPERYWTMFAGTVAFVAI